MKKQAKGPKFRVGQVVKHRIQGGFYMKILHRHQATGLKWVVMEQGDIVVYRQGQLRPLSVREAGPARGRKRNV